MFSDQLQESLAAGAVWGTYKGVEIMREYGKYNTIRQINPHMVYIAAVEGAKAFGAAASGLYAYHLLAGHIHNTTPNRMQNLQKREGKW